MPAQGPQVTRDRIAVGVDGSESSLRAVRLAAHEAALQRRPLRIVHALNWIPDQSAPSDGEPRPAAEALVNRAAALAEQVAPGLETEVAIGEGTLTGTLLRESNLAGLIVLGDGGLDRHTCLPLDAPAVQLASRSKCSVMLARGEQTGDEGPVLVGVDRSAGGERALEFAFEAAANRRAELVVVRALDSDAPEDADVTAAQLAEAVGPWQEKYSGVTTRRHVLAGEPPQVMVAQSKSAALVVVGARGEHPVRTPLGSVTQAVLHHAPCTTVVVRAIPPTA
ncbi:Nucleotide-binding universal stress protein, UspA family [Micromonospora pattaloongensis]|uniref:Nucleotide-binding universal stress protein, UspA family n=1 Tax=Micromonospora pattaloongensis TaxID=405436 RepID=A0A1H3JJD2_9ACTN|nr:universal stress protein [Micromonospora pattaloongensis]SDY39625.1 Nucleotide-binding universal stress protein, UspA family [Micromonospora pattaloongensis]